MNQCLEEDLTINIPLYCYHSKFFMVEELALNVDFHELHYGRCCVIGKIAVDSTDPSQIYIENIRLPSLPKSYSLPEGTVRLKIVTTNLRHYVPHGKICEVIGETILYNRIDRVSNRQPLTSKDVADRLSYLRSKNLSEAEYQEYLIERYCPAVIVDHLRPIESAAELIERNLQIRMLSEDGT